MSAASSAGAGVLTPFRRRSPAPGIPEPSRAEAADGRLSSGIGGRSPGKSPSQQPFVASASGIVWAASGGPMCLSASTFGTSLGWPGEESQAAADEIPETPHWALRSGQPWTPMRDAGRLFSIADNEAGEAAARAGDDAAAFGAEGGRAEQTASEADEAPSRSKRPRLLEKGLEEEEIAHEDSTGAAMALNAVVALLAGIVKVIILCLGDVLEWMSQYCFVQCALRGLSFWQAAKATYAMTSISNLDYFVSQVTVGWVVAMGAILCALSGALAAGLLGYYTCGIPGFGVYLAMIGGVFGCFSGMMTGGSALGVMNSGTATILMCWAETPDAWEKENPAIHEKFTAASSMMDRE
eukprot:TRINITY_DN3163_c0_g2_i2.p1 TRINITY_DN3163_c0_g2~~TRINITY_DN3163_c0_g2_i2.p1  ORF type:complete len:353 (+),score=69.00 TRINITY_DN3163_c0_g2_i2:86-1144(+)